MTPGHAPLSPPAPVGSTVPLQGEEMEVEDLGIERMEVEGLDVSRILSPPTLDDQDDVRMGDHPDNADSEGSEEGVGAWLALHPVIKMATIDKVMKLRMRKSSS